MAQHYLEQVARKPKTSKAGKPYISLGIKVNGQWWNGFEAKWNAGWDTGMTVDCELYEDKGFKNFKEVDQVAKVDGKFMELEQRVRELEKFVFEFNFKNSEPTQAPAPLPRVKAPMMPSRPTEVVDAIQRARAAQAGQATKAKSEELPPFPDDDFPF